MKKSQIALLLILLLAAFPAFSQIAVGKWRDHLSYNRIIHVEDAGNRIYASSPGALYYYDLDDLTVNRLNKTTILSDVDVSTFAYDPKTHYVVVAYSNANVDIVKGDAVSNINDIKRSNLGGSKRINSIGFYNRKAFLACAFGIVVLDMNRDEISETIYLGDYGGMMNVNDVLFTDSHIVAATDSGIYMAPKNSQTLGIITTWQRDNSSLVAGQRVTRLATLDDGRLMALVQSDNDSTIYVETSTMTFAPFVAGDIKSFRVCRDTVVVCKEHQVELYRSDGTMILTIGAVDWIDMQANDALLAKEGHLWVAHNWASLIAINPRDLSSVNSVTPGGPYRAYAYSVTTFDSVVYVSPGGHRSTYEGVYYAANVYSYKGNRWNALKDSKGILSGKMDVLHVAVNPRNPSQVLATSWGNGVLEITDNEVTGFYNDSNTNGAISRLTLDDYSAVFTGGVAFDKNGNAWITNSLVNHALVVRSSDGKWKNFNTMGVVTSDIDNIIWDSIHDTKLFWGRQNRVFVHDGDSRISYIDPNNGAKLQTSSVSCLTQDHSGHIWMGTNKGIKVIYNLDKAFENGGNGELSPVTCNNILFNENGITEYLMAYESITCIAVDGANRKWVGTSTGGLYLLSANGLQQLEHFTSTNSPLFSDKILSLAIMPWSGELFIVTDRGVQSYRTTATYAFTTPMEDIYAFPNPVRPDFEGLIAIKGFTRNAIVHITDASGNTVFSTRANGGQAMWDGRTHDGKKVSSGVYYVFASAEDGGMRSVTKILIVN